MFTLDNVIDTVQNTNKQFVDIFVPNESMAKAFNEIIDANSQYAKIAYKSSFGIAGGIVQEMLQGMANAAKFDYAKFGDSVTKACSEINKQAEKAAKAYGKKV